MAGTKETQRKNEYAAAKYDAIRINVPKGRRADIQKYCDSIGTTTQGLVNELLRFELGFTPEQWKERATTEE